MYRDLKFISSRVQLVPCRLQGRQWIGLILELVPHVLVWRSSACCLVRVSAAKMQYFCMFADEKPLKPRRQKREFCRFVFSRGGIFVILLEKRTKKRKTEH
jgi:hypothetical protein